MNDTILANTGNSSSRWYHFWPLLIAPSSLLTVATASLIAGDLEGLDSALEVAAPWMALATLAIYLVRGIATRNPLYVIMIFAAGTLLLRELHWSDDTWSPLIKKAAPVLVVIVVIWMIAWRDLLRKPFSDDRRLTVWLIAATLSFTLSQLIERRIFRFMPGEGPIHSKLEEVAEMSGHLAMLIGAIVGKWHYYDVNQRVCSIREGFWTGPTGQLWAKLKGRPSKSPEPAGEAFLTDRKNTSQQDEA